MHATETVVCKKNFCGILPVGFDNHLSGDCAGAQIIFVEAIFVKVGN